MRFQVTQQTISILLVALAAASPTTQVPKCRCSPCEPCWPQPTEVYEFGKGLSSAEVLLSDIRPPAAVCHGTSYDAARCKVAKELWTNPFWRSEQPGAMQAPLLESQEALSSNVTLLCDVIAPREAQCEQGKVPTIGIAAQNDNDIAHALDFAHRHNLRVVVKGTGHDFYGRSTASDGFLIWTHNMKQRTFEHDLKPIGCETVRSKQALRLGAGVQWEEAYMTAAAYNRTLAGGILANGTVGAAGGWLTGGGHSILSPCFGLGVDNVLQIRVVLPSTDGMETAYSGKPRVLDVSACSDPELFWALRGGGGNSFGVISEVVYQTHDDFTGVGAGLNIYVADPSLAKEIAVELMHSVGTTFFDEHWGGYTTFTPGVPGISNSTITLLLFKPHVVFDSTDEKQYNQTFQTLERQLRALLGSPEPVGSVFRVSGFQQILDSLNPPAAGSSGSATSATKRNEAHEHVVRRREDSPEDNATATFGTSRLLPRALFASREDLRAYLDIVHDSAVLGHNVLGGRVADFDPNSAAAHPGWRENAMHVVTVPVGTITENQAADQRKGVTELVWGKENARAQVASYLNEQNPTDEYWPDSFYGSHWHKLSTIKEEVDPHDQLIVTKGVGSERWSADGACRVEQRI